MPRLTLLIDADDTLWENNVFFEETIEEFITLVEPLGYSREYARRILNETERLQYPPARIWREVLWPFAR